MLKKALKAISVTLTLFTLILALLLAGVRLVGLQPYTVISGSMSPAYAVGSLIYVKHTAPENVKVGDPITFVLNEDLVVATHRVVAIDTENQCFYTKGDANDTADGSPVHFNNLIGVPVFCIPWLGYLSDFISHPPGLYFALVIAAAAILLAFIPDLLKKASEADNRKREKDGSKSEIKAQTP